MTKDGQKYCVGCKNDFYNGNNDMGIAECWYLKTARIVTRWRIGWHTPQDNAANFRKVTTYHCHYAPGRYADYEQIPEHLRER